MKKTLWRLALFGIISACSCHKTAVEPPFQNSFSCKINGQLWEPNGPDGFFGFQKTLSYYFAPGETGLGIQARNKVNNQTLTISCFCKEDIGIYKIRNEDFTDFNKKCGYLSDTLRKGTITFINVDKVKRILKGTFEFIATNSGNCNDTLKFTNGMFELNY